MNRCTPRPIRPVAGPSILLAACLLLFACGGGERPALGEWNSGWQATIAHTPPIPLHGDGDGDGDGSEPIDPAACNELLVAAREARPALLPSPDDALDRTVDEWIVLAESIGFDCHRHPDLVTALEELHLLEDSVSDRVDALQNTP